jgi:hypothetical protein
MTISATNPLLAELATLREGGGGINLDGYSQSDEAMLKLANVLTRSATSAARVLFPGRPKGFVRATKDLGRYAWNQGTAMRLRLTGDVNLASDYEAICDRIYAGLPEFARW